MNNGAPKTNASYFLTIELSTSRPRIDTVLLEELRKQNENHYLRNISRTEYKELFKKKRIRIKGQSAVPSSALAKGSTIIEVVGYEQKDPAE
ncbi:MAG: hypothetical protein H7222_09600 [Methylotenera sp.]|nr:hypothetical protein [Oligoflexia bacterium]